MCVFAILSAIIAGNTYPTLALGTSRERDTRSAFLPLSGKRILQNAQFSGALLAALVVLSRISSSLSGAGPLVILGENAGERCSRPGVGDITMSGRFPQIYRAFVDNGAAAGEGGTSDGARS